MSELYVERGTLHVENGTVEIAALLREGVVEMTARGHHGISPVRMTVEQAMTLGNKLTEAARDVRRAAPIGARGNE